MTESISYAGLVIAILLPWLLGCLVVYRLTTQAGQWTWPSVIGQGYLLGIFLTTIILRMWDWAGLTLSFWPITGLLLSLTIILFALQLVRPKPLSNKLASARLENWQAVLVLVLMGLVAWKYLTILQEILDKPLYAWDAWMNWAPKAVVWHHNQALVNYVSPEQWLQASPGETLYTLGARSAWKYPPMLPLLQLWTMLGAGTPDHSLLYLPWWLLAVSIGLAIYGHLRLAGCSVTMAIVACYLLLSMPYFNVHTALVGYADIWLAAAFSMAIFALREWRCDAQKGYAILCLILAFTCTQLKMPGIVLGLIVLAVYLRALLNWSGKTELAVGLLVAGLIGGLLFLGFDATIPGIGHIAVDDKKIEAAFFGTFSLEYHNVSIAFIKSFFHSGSWNIFWPILLVLLAFRAMSGNFPSRPSNELLACLGVALFLFFIFYFTDHYRSALNMSTLNRAVMYLIPTLIFYVFVNILQPEESNQPGNSSG
jgi:hypothetical protein